MKENKLIIFIVIILSGILLMMSNYLKKVKMDVYDEFNQSLIKVSTKKEEKKEVPKEEPHEEVRVEAPKEEVNTYYIGTLSIPKINFEKGFLDKNHPDNTIEKNIEFLKSSDYPDQQKHNVVIAGHSGTGYLAFFNDLNKLVKGDELFLTYKNKKYIYSIDKIYLEDRRGKIGILKDYNRSSLSLITCTLHDKKHQTVYIAYLKDVIEL